MDVKVIVIFNLPKIIRKFFRKYFAVSFPFYNLCGMKNWLKENWMVILGIGFVVVYFVVLNNIVSSDTAKAWFSKPATSITVGDIFIIALIHAFINRSDKK